jgi:hypothetical protein
MALQFKRAYELNLINPEGRVITSRDLRITFEIEKNLFGYPNLAKIVVYNLSVPRATEISEEFTDVELKAGYGTNVITLFRGNIRNIENIRASVDTLTTIYAGDGEKPIRETNFTKTFAPGTSLSQMVNEIADAFGIPKAKLDGIQGKVRNLNGLSFSGPAKELLNKLSDDYGFYWSIQDNQFVTQDRESYDDANTVIEVNKNTGMLGSPTITEIGANVKILLNPDAQPYRAFRIESTSAQLAVGNLFFRKDLPTLGEGFFRINKVTHNGDTRGNNWYSTLEGRRI